jgi:hypothetical protein
MTWIALSEQAPEVGAWVLMYLTRYGGVDRYRAGMYMGPDDWMSAANWAETLASKPPIRDADVSHWMSLPSSPDETLWQKIQYSNKDTPAPPNATTEPTERSTKT